MAGKHQFTDTDHLHRALQELDCNQTELAEKLGMSGSAVNRWMTDEKSPVWSVLACEALLAHKTRCNVIVCSPQSPDSQYALVALLKAMKMPYVEVKP